MAEPPGATTSVAGWVEMTGALPAEPAFTVSEADALVARPTPLLTRTEYPPASPAAACAMLWNAETAPAMGVPLRSHWKLNGPLPLTPTAKVAVLPAFTTTATGCVTMLGATGCTGPSLTVSAAVSLTTLPAVLLTSTE